MAERKFSVDDVHAIRSAYADGAKVDVLAAQYNASRTVVLKLLRGETYKDITQGYAVPRKSHHQSVIQSVKCVRSSKQMREVVKVLHDAGYSALSMRLVLACSERTITRFLSELGIYRK